MLVDVGEYLVAGLSTIIEEIDILGRREKLTTTTTYNWKNNHGVIMLIRDT
jgi:hypothetical protein